MAFVEGFGSYLPPQIVPNDVLAARLGCEAGWILQVSGIAERRYAAADQDVADLAVLAARDCLDRTGRGASDVRLVIVSSASEQKRFPGIAAVVAHRLGMDQVPALDIPVASAGSLIAMIVAHALANTYKRILIVAAEKMSTIVLREPIDRNLAILFGDGAGACLLSSTEGKAEVTDTTLHSDGSFASSLELSESGVMSMDGRTVIMQASRKLPRAISELLERNDLAPGRVDRFLMHQANQNLTNGVARALGVPTDRFFSNIDRCGNTSSASMLIAASEWAVSEGFRTGAAVVFAAFGAGFHWGALLAQGT